MPKRNTPTTVVYSESLGDRDYLRSRLEDHGFKTICFENENICIDNFQSVLPKIVIVRTNSSNVGWRFVLALNSLRMNSPLVFISHVLDTNQYSAWPSGIPIYALPAENENDQWISSIKHILNENRSINSIQSLPPFLGESNAISAIRSTVQNVADSYDPILIVGEKGTGKELLSRCIARSSNRSGAFIKVDCGILCADISIHDWLSEIVGQESIVIFLSNIHHMTKSVQMGFLLFMDKVEYWSSSTSTQGHRDIRIIATSDVNIETLVENGAFRKDLFYRLNVISIVIPPLRERKSDIYLLMDYFSINTCINNNKCVMIPSKNTRKMMYMHDWPGNVEELKGYMERIVATGDENSILVNNHLPVPKRNKREYLFNADGLEALPRSFEIEGFLDKKNNLALKGISREFVSRTEKKFMKKALELTNWNRKKAAEILNISYKSMLNKMKAYDII